MCTLTVFWNVRKINCYIMQGTLNFHSWHIKSWDGHTWSHKVTLYFLNIYFTYSVLTGNVNLVIIQSYPIKQQQTLVANEFKFCVEPTSFTQPPKTAFIIFTCTIKDVFRALPEAISILYNQNTPTHPPDDIGTIPVEEVECVWMSWLHRLAKVNDPALLFMPQDVVLTQVSVHQVAPMEHLHHRLDKNNIGNKYCITFTSLTVPKSLFQQLKLNEIPYARTKWKQWTEGHFLNGKHFGGWLNEPRPVVVAFSPPPLVHRPHTGQPGTSVPPSALVLACGHHQWRT